MKTEINKKYLIILLVLISVLFGRKQVLAADSPDHFYYDEINILNDATKNLVEEKNSYYQGKKDAPQIVVAVISSTNDEDIDSYAPELFQKWQIGSKNKDNGVLILYALNNGKRNVRIEVGYGLEGELTDKLAAQILSDNKSDLKSDDNKRVNRGLERVFKDVSGVVDRSNGYQTADSKKMIVKPRVSSKFILLMILLLIYLGLVAFDNFKYDSKRHSVLTGLSYLFFFFTFISSKVLWIVPLIYLFFNQNGGSSGGGYSGGGFSGGGSSGGSSSGGGGFSGGGGSSGGGGASI
ncbi:TPM domain-containing protein [Xylocopilactobacillus apicola]|uniref:TPM domain-containing protein n=1 Tax=Xylocopilactobacillus apicola TaxID=2932184 RepID=A0AAU9CV13_9LACO|nr:TPM domain-containing protein [Xylocopilactobacillus apicola]BDR57832.1 hypothetical protein XA3_02730 [Xylocopilactobacillus apicola]